MTTGLYLPNQNSVAGNHIISSYAEQIATQETFRLGLDIEKSTGRLMMASASVANPQSQVDVSWLPASAEEYKISPDIRDYVLAEVPIVEGDVPNRNMDCFLSTRLVQFLPKFGCQAFKTFIGKPVFYEHQHDDNTKAKGVIFDACMREVNGRWFVFILKGFDRTKDRSLAEQVLSGKRRGHSMSAWTQFVDCSVCGHRWDTSYEAACDHMKGPHSYRSNGKFAGKGLLHGSALAYDLVYDFHFFESSSVGDPANYGAFQVQQTTLGA